MLRGALALFGALALVGCNMGVSTPEILPGLPAPNAKPQGWIPNVGEMRKLHNDRVTAREERKQAHSIDARGRDALNRGNAVEAVTEYRRGLRKEPENPQLHLGMASASYRMGDLDTAATHAGIVLKDGGPGVPEAAQLLVTLESSRGNYREAREAAQQWARWAEQEGQPVMAMDSWLLASRLSHMYLNDSSGTYYALEKARAHANPANTEAATRFHQYEADLQRTRLGPR